MRSSLVRCRNALRRALAGLAALLLLGAPVCANAMVSFRLVYDDRGGTGSIDTVIGTGTFSYDGPLALGYFALESLTGIAFDASFKNGDIFTVDDMSTDVRVSGVRVFDRGGGVIGLIFTGEGGADGGSFDLRNSAGATLSHEPTDYIDDPLGCCGGNGVVNQYYESGREGIRDYRATLQAPVPEPAVYVLFGLGLSAIGLARRRFAPPSK